ncbi:MAG TPA: hypothetical protein VKE95_11595 [Burkholderiales bacterium]|nr:hypothetical protein [Burkholderiales bacterium]
MTRLALVAPIAVLAALSAGCASRGPAQPAPVAISPIEQPYRAGTGVVQAVTPAPKAVVAGPGSSPGNAAAPMASARSPATVSQAEMQRLRIRMDDGRTLYVDTPSREFKAGERVLLSDANEIRPQ